MARCMLLYVVLIHTGGGLMTASKKLSSYKRSLLLAHRLWPTQIGSEQRRTLRFLSDRHKFSIAAGDLQLLENRWYVTHSGLLRLAQQRRCAGINVTLVSDVCEEASSRWVFKATVYKTGNNTRGFVGHGDADPSNVSTLMHWAEMRIAETRAVNRALRKAYGIGLCSVEELGSVSTNSGSSRTQETSTKPSSNGSSKGEPRLRDQ